MGKIVKSTDKNGQVTYPVTLDEAVVVTLGDNKKTLKQHLAHPNSTPIMSALYTGLYYGANSTNNGYFEPICVKPKDTSNVIGKYYIRFRMSTSSTGYASYKNYSDIELWFNRTGSVNCYRIWNWRVGSNLHNTVGINYPSTNAYFNTSGTHIGVGITADNNYNNASYKRDTLIEILEVSEDLIVTLDLPSETKQYTKMSWYNSTALPNHTTLNAKDVGLQETGDNNTYDRTYFGNTSMSVSSTFRTVGNTLNGFDSDGKVFSLGRYGTAADTTARVNATSKGEWASGKAYAVRDYIHYTNDIFYRCIKAHTSSTSILPTNTTYWQIYREYNHNGIDYRRGLFYGAGNYASGTVGTNMTMYFAITAIDLRYTFNCIASNAAANTLGIEMGKDVYIRGYIKDGLFYIAPTTVTYSGNPYYKCWTQDPVDEAITVDGVTYPVCYWLIGSAYYNSSYTTRGYQVTLFHDNPMFVFLGGRLVDYRDKTILDLQHQLQQFNSVVSAAIASLDERVRLLM